MLEMDVGAKDATSTVCRQMVRSKKLRELDGLDSLISASAATASEKSGSDLEACMRVQDDTERRSRSSRTAA